MGLTMTVRAGEFAGWLLISSLISFNWHVMAQFLLGNALMRTGWLAAERRLHHGRLALLGLGTGLVLEAVAVALQLATDSTATL
ncbi:MAG: hypothetical protein MPN21_08950, partial [Thermoanaerobaculia bacterium]|nr:hypothetical protein [Thermoanaerobaculia bacterium]